MEVVSSRGVRDAEQVFDSVIGDGAVGSRALEDARLPPLLTRFYSLPAFLARLLGEVRVGKGGRIVFLFAEIPTDKKSDGERSERDENGGHE